MSPRFPLFFGKASIIMTKTDVKACIFREINILSGQEVLLLRKHGPPNHFSPVAGKRQERNAYLL